MGIPGDLFKVLSDLKYLSTMLKEIRTTQLQVQNKLEDYSVRITVLEDRFANFQKGIEEQNQETKELKTELVRAMAFIEVMHRRGMLPPSKN